ncbi:hypothetical protein E2562_002026 [Oryza meyeriana var. granulata]|uniref:Uncharacterized protein n=1 Tax=Oryza meyeriana var. granulata TaxID=110450 RepID=A0A6G1C3H5_9ORYZ|nr:hypothetical protein E2562_002026 [Oryza meyeriana var. granulata]
MGRGSLMEPREGLPRPPPAAPPVSSIQAGTAAGRAGPAHGRPGQAADGQPAGAQAARPQAKADHSPPASSSRKRPLAAKKKDEQDIPGCAKFRKKPIQNEDLLREMFTNITNDEANHWNPLSDNPIIPNSQEQPFDLDSEYVDGENNAQGDPFDANQEGDEEVQEVTPSAAEHTTEHTPNIDQGHSRPFSQKPHIPRAGARLRAKQVYLLQKLHSGAALWWSWWSRAGKGGAEQSQTGP